MQLCPRNILSTHRGHARPCRSTLPGHFRKTRKTNAVAQAETATPRADLLALVAGLNRGSLATLTQTTDIAIAIKNLEDAGAGALTAMDSMMVEDALSGRWQLVYTSATEVFRSSPFFWAFQEFIGNGEIASQIFRFTDGIPGAEVGQAYQTFDFVQGQLISEVDLEVFPGAKGTVVTTCSVQLGVPPTTLLVTVDSTRVTGSNLLPQLFDQVSVPVKSLVEGVRGVGSTRVSAEITYLDGQLRVTRTPFDGKVFVYRKVQA